MRSVLTFTSIFLVLALWMATGVFALFLHTKQPRHSGYLILPGLEHPVEAKFDRWGIPHIYAQAENDAYRALGYLHAQERLFQMEMSRRVARGELAEVFGAELVSVDRLFRTLRLARFADEFVAAKNLDEPVFQAAQAYLDGVNHFLENGPRPIEFQMLDIDPRPFTLADTVAIGGYMAYTFSHGFQTDPLLTFIRDRYGAAYLADLGFQKSEGGAVPEAVHAVMQQVSAVMHAADEALGGQPSFAGSNAWAISGARTFSGKPILASDPHIAFSQPSVWWEAHLVVQPEDAESPVFELYGHHLAGVPFALLGHNPAMGWGVTMFKNDDTDMYVEAFDPAQPGKVKYRGDWVDLVTETEVIRVRDSDDVAHVVRVTPHGPIISDVIPALAASPRPVAVRWGYHDPDNGLFRAFYELSRSQSLEQARRAVSRIHAPGLNIMYANAGGDIAWWAAARIPERRAGLHPGFMLDGASGADEPLGRWPFADNPQRENPESGYLLSANNEPRSETRGRVWGYYNVPERAQRIGTLLQAKEKNWTVEDMKSIQLDTRTDYYAGLNTLIPPIVEKSLVNNPDVLAAEALAFFWEWDGSHDVDDVAPTIFQEFLFQFLRLTFLDELGEAYFESLLKTKLVDKTVPVLLRNRQSPWWDNVTTPHVETRDQLIAQAWIQATQVLKDRFGSRPVKWTWGKAHRLLHVHPVGRRKPFDRFFNVGPFPAPGGRETINNLSNKIESGVHDVYHGPSTRRLLDFGDIDHALGINPTGQAGFFLNRHYDDQAYLFATGQYRTQITDPRTIHANHKSLLVFAPR